MPWVFGLSLLKIGGSCEEVEKEVDVGWAVTFPSI